MTIGFVGMIAGMLWYTQIPVHASYWSDLLPGYLLVGFAIPFAFIPVSIAALAGVDRDEAGLASGLINTAQQIGGAIGVAVDVLGLAQPLQPPAEDGSLVPERVHLGFAVGVLGAASASASPASPRRSSSCASPSSRRYRRKRWRPRRPLTARIAPVGFRPPWRATTQP